MSDKDNDNKTDASVVPFKGRNSNSSGSGPRGPSGPTDFEDIHERLKSLEHSQAKLKKLVSNSKYWAIGTGLSLFFGFISILQVNSNQQTQNLNQQIEQQNALIRQQSTWIQQSLSDSAGDIEKLSDKIDRLDGNITRFQIDYYKSRNPDTR